jgi:competence protein ComEA
MNKQSLALAILLTLALVSLPAAAQTATQPTSTQPQGNQSSSASSGKRGARSSASNSAKIDINRASKDELMKLEGISDSIASKIIAGRPYRTKRELLTRQILNRATYDRLREKIIAHAVKPAAKSAAATK